MEHYFDILGDCPSQQIYVITVDRLHRLMEKEHNEFRRKYTYKGKWVKLTDDEYSAVHNMSSRIEYFPSKAFTDALEQINGDIADDMNKILNKWKPVADHLRKLKGKLK